MTIDVPAATEPVVHACPPPGSGIMPCCGLTPFERPSDRMALAPEYVTCNRLGKGGSIVTMRNRDDLEDYVIDRVVSVANPDVIDEQGIAMVVGMTFTVLRMAGYRVVNRDGEQVDLEGQS